MRYLIIKLISFYQKYLSPDHSFWGKERFPYGYCRFYPTCSEYTKEAVRERGIFSGLGKGVWRILRCNPFTSPAHDPVIKK